MEKSEWPVHETVELVYSPQARQVFSVVMDWGTLLGVQNEKVVTVKDALLASGLLERFPELDLQVLSVGIWGAKAALESTVEPHDRIEIYRDLLVDPKEARRLRHKKQGPVGLLYRPSYKTKT